MLNPLTVDLKIFSIDAFYCHLAAIVLLDLRFASIPVRRGALCVSKIKLKKKLGPGNISPPLIGI